MKKEKLNLVTLGELSMEMGVNKSKLNYYTHSGLLKPVRIAGKTMLFDRKSVTRDIKNIEKHKKNGKKLKEIKTIL